MHIMLADMEHWLGLLKLKPLVLSVWGSDVYDFPYQSKLKMGIVKEICSMLIKLRLQVYAWQNK